jgi:phage host-nuclease inhibitor protein Gam
MSKNTMRKRAKSAVIKNESELVEAVTTAAGKLLEHDEIMLVVERKMRAIKEDLIVQAEALKKEANDLVKRIQKYATAHRDEVFGGKQGITVAGHTLEFRKSPGRTATLKGYTVQDVVDALLVLEDESLSEKLTSVKASLAKDAVIDYWETGEPAQEFLRSLGIEVVKDEAFKFTPSKTGKTGEGVTGEKEVRND